MLSVSFARPQGDRPAGDRPPRTGGFGAVIAEVASAAETTVEVTEADTNPTAYAKST
jgi:hypothetical protein